MHAAAIAATPRGSPVVATLSPMAEKLHGQQARTVGVAAGSAGERVVERCINCHFFDRHAKGSEAKAGHSGQCRRCAPALSPINAKSYMIEGVWPTIRDDDWCGEWKASARRADASRVADVLSNAAARTAAAERLIRDSESLAMLSSRVRTQPEPSTAKPAVVASGSARADQAS
jgi:hypothetical protein